MCRWSNGYHNQQVIHWNEVCLKIIKSHFENLKILDIGWEPGGEWKCISSKSQIHQGHRERKTSRNVYTRASQVRKLVPAMLCSDGIITSVHTGAWYFSLKYYGFPYHFCIGDCLYCFVSMKNTVVSTLTHTFACSLLQLGLLLCDHICLRNSQSFVNP